MTDKIKFPYNLRKVQSYEDLKRIRDDEVSDDDQEDLPSSSSIFSESPASYSIVSSVEVLIDHGYTIEIHGITL